MIPNNPQTNRKVYRLLLLTVLLISICVSGTGTVVQARRHKKEWVMSKKGRIYYYDENGKKLTNGPKRIGKKYYYFDEKGMQHVGWIKYKGHYYYYRIGAKKKGYRVCDKTVNGIKLNGKGWAVTNLEKARLLTEANKIVFSITNFKMSQKEKNKACFLYIRNNTDWRNLTSFRKDLENWDQHYAAYAIIKGYGDCYTGGCGFAYLAAAAGAKKVYAESSGGHGWAEIDGNYYDPNWSWAMKNVDDYFDVPESLSGKNGRPGWARNKSYIKRID